MRVSAHKISALLTLILGLMAAVAAGEASLVRGGWYQGIIVPVEWAEANSHLTQEFSGFWVPSTNDVATAEAAVRAYIAAADTDSRLSPYTRKQAPAISKKPPTYRRQYVGVMVGAERRILFNVLTPKTTKHPKWRSQYVYLIEGGPDCWKIQYIPATKQCLKFDASFGY
jgi:hypothetical protein